MEQYLRYVAAVVGTAAHYLWGGWDAVLMALVVLAALDFVTGVLAAVVNKEVDSSIGARGVIRKVTMFAIVAVANILDSVLDMPDPMLRTAVIWFYIVVEGTSILENAGAAGVPIPDAIRKVLGRLKDDSDN